MAKSKNTSGIWDKIRGAFTPPTTTIHNTHVTSHSPTLGAHGANTSKKPNLDGDYVGYNTWGQPPQIKMQKMLDYYESSMIFSTVIDMHVEETAGHGYHLSAGNSDHAMADDVIQEINKWAAKFNLRKWLKAGALDAWLTGNFFATPLVLGPGEDGEMTSSGLEVIPISTIAGIYQENGEIHHYRQESSGLAGGFRTIPVDEIIHFSRNNLNASPWGRGLGQRYCTRGSGYTDPTGHTVYKPSQAEIEEMTSHINAMLAYAALPRFVAMFDSLDAEQQDKLTKELSEAPPMSALVLGDTTGKVESLSLTTQSKLAELLKQARDDTVVGMMAPFVHLWTSPTFTFNSAEVGVGATLPLIAGFEQEFAHFVEYNVLRPLTAAITGSETAYDEIDIKFAWGQPDMRSIEDVEKAWKVARHMKDRFDENAFVDLINECGFKLPPPTPEQIKKQEDNKEQMMQAMQGKQEQEDEQDKLDNAFKAVMYKRVSNMYSVDNNQKHLPKEEEGAEK